MKFRLKRYTHNEIDTLNHYLYDIQFVFCPEAEQRQGKSFACQYCDMKNLCPDAIKIIDYLQSEIANGYPRCKE